MKQQCTYWQKWSKCLRTFVPTSRKSATVRFADYRQIPAFPQLPEIYVVSLPNCLQLHARLSCSMTAIAVLMSNSKNASSIIGDWHSVKAQIPSSGPLPRSMALSCALSPIFHHLLSPPDVSVLCIAPGMVNGCIAFSQNVLTGQCHQGISISSDCPL